MNSKATTEINIDYFEELKAKADFVDVLLKYTDTGEISITMHGKCRKEIMPLYIKIKQEDNQ